MASRQFFGYDPYDYYYTAAQYNYPYDYDPYYQRQPAASTRSRKCRGIFAGAGEPAAAAKPAPRARDTKTSFSIPVHGPDSDPEPERERKAAPAMSAEEAAVRMQAAARGFLARKSVRAVREVAREAKEVRVKMMASEAEALLAEDPRARVAVGEALMRMLLRLDAVRGAREYRRRVTKRVLALQDAVDALETKPAPLAEEADVDASEAAAVEMAEESVAVPELEDAAERGSETESIKTAVHTQTQMEVDEAMATGEPEAEEPEQGAAGEEQEAGEEKEAVPGDANDDVDESEDSDAEGEWEMVTEEENEHTAPVAATSDDDQEPPSKEEPACPLEATRTASAGAASADGVDVMKMMQMVAALCEQNAKQCAVIGALAERVDALERTVRRMEDAESRRRRAKKLSTEGK